MQIISVRSFLDYYDRIRDRTIRVINLIPPSQIEYTYMPGKFSIGDEIRHIAGIERYMFAETIAGRSSAYPGCGKEVADGHEKIMKYFNELHLEALGIFSRLTDAELSEKCMTPGKVQMPIWKWLRAMIEHEIHHRGKLYVYLNLLNIDAPPLFGLTSEEVRKRSKVPTF
jgi:uncharacterized damage-inducible protein DinB